MSEKAKNVVLISASPKVNEESLSNFLTSLAKDKMEAGGLHTALVDVRQSITKGKTQADYETMLKADALVIVFPLYIFCLPGILTRFLEDYYQYYTQNKDKAGNPKVYAVVNCGFPEPDINTEAVRVIESFSRKTGASFRFGLMIGGGGMILGTKDAPFMKKMMDKINGAFARMEKDIQAGETLSVENVCVPLNFNRKLYFFMADRGWYSMARKNGVKKKDIYNKPYRTN